MNKNSKTDLNIENLYDDFISKINAMSWKELLESAQSAEKSSRYANIIDDDYFSEYD